jgi:hypothetical protein
VIDQNNGHGLALVPHDHGAAKVDSFPGEGGANQDPAWVIPERPHVSNRQAPTAQGYEGGRHLPTRLNLVVEERLLAIEPRVAGHDAKVVDAALPTAYDDCCLLRSAAHALFFLVHPLAVPRSFLVLT